MTVVEDLTIWGDFETALGGAPWSDMYGWFPGATFNATQNVYERSNGWASTGSWSLHYKATATGDLAHASVTTGPTRAPHGAVGANEIIRMTFDANVIQKGQYGPAPYIVFTGPGGWVDPEGEQHGQLLNLGVTEDVTFERRTPEGATGVLLVALGNGGGGVGGDAPNYLSTGEVSEFYIDNFRVEAEMARGNLAITTIDEDGVVPPAETAGDATNGHELASNDGKVFIRARNSGAVSRNLTIATPEKIGALDVAENVIAVAAGATVYVGPLKPNVYNQPTTGKVNIDVAHAELVLQAFRMNV